MGSPRHCWLRQGRSRRGLVLVEIMLFLVVIALAILLAILVFSRVRHNARLAEFGAQLQACAAAIETSRAERGRWPATADEAGPALLAAGWDDGPKVGGEFGWIPPASGRPGLITVRAFVPAPAIDATRADLRAVDRAIDDGELAAGRFRTGFNGWPVYQVADNP
jgi:type II secretory pathway pseudopilin PulG